MKAVACAAHTDCERLSLLFADTGKVQRASTLGAFYAHANVHRTL